MSSTPKATNVIAEERVNEIIPLVTILRRQEIIRYVKNKLGWDLKDQTIDIYIKRANKAIAKELIKDRKKAVQRSYNNLRTFMKKALQNEDIQLCLKIQERMDKIFNVGENSEDENKRILDMIESGKIKVNDKVIE